MTRQTTRLSIKTLAQTHPYLEQVSYLRRSHGPASGADVYGHFLCPQSGHLLNGTTWFLTMWLLFIKWTVAMVTDLSITNSPGFCHLIWNCVKSGLMIAKQHAISKHIVICIYWQFKRTLKKMWWAGDAGDRGINPVTDKTFSCAAIHFLAMYNLEHHQRPVPLIPCQ